MNNQCCIPKPPVRKHESQLNSLSSDRVNLIRRVRNNWINGTKITWAMQKTNAADANSVIKAVAEWQNAVKGLTLEKTDDWNKAMIRIAFPYQGASYSYVGTDNLLVSAPEPTMVFGWSLADTWGRQTARHEWGHALGFYHEHQNPFSGIIWDEREVLRTFSGPPNNWSEEQIRHNILTPMNKQDVEGSNWDSDSVMHYEFGPKLIKYPPYYSQYGLYPQINGLSKTDIKRAELFYPSLDGEDEDQGGPVEIKELKKGVPLTLSDAEAGKEYHFKFTANKGECISVEMTGNVDTVLVLKDENGNQIKADDDTGFSRNAKVTQWSRSAREHLVDLRIVWKDSGSSVGILRK